MGTFGCFANGPTTPLNLTIEPHGEDLTVQFPNPIGRQHTFTLHRFIAIDQTSLKGSGSSFLILCYMISRSRFLADTDEEVGSVGVAWGEVHGEMAAVSAASSSETGDESGIGMAAASATASSSGGVADENNPLRTQYGGARRRDDSDSDSNSRYGGPDDGDGGGKPKAKKIRGNK